MRRIKLRERPTRGLGSGLMFTSSAIARTPIIILGLVAVLMFWGCKSTPSPIIVGDTYTNIEYEYSIRIPQGWEPLNEIPDEFGYFKALPINPEFCSLMLYNEKSGGLIAIMNSVMRIAYDDYFEVSYAIWDESLSGLKSTMEKDLKAVAFKYNINMENLHTTQQNYFANQYSYKPEELIGVESSFEFADQRAHFNFSNYWFPCRNTKTCKTIVILACYDQNLAQNQQAFGAVLSSLRAHDYYE